jgi:hypothetical protein
MAYSWERPNDSFLRLQEDASGQLQDMDEMLQENAPEEEADTQRAKRRMVRYVVLVVDLSEGLSDTDFRPSRFTVFSRTVELDECGAVVPARPAVCIGICIGISMGANKW